MKGLNLVFVILILESALSGQAGAQAAIVGSGNNASGSGGTASFTMGQIDFRAFTGTDGSVYQGVQQPYEFFSVGAEEIPGVFLFCSLYPNPTTELVTLYVSDITVLNLRYELYDLGGRLLRSGNVTTLETTIPMGHLPAAVYILKVFNKEARQIFQIIKYQ